MFKHTSKAFDEELNELAERIREMGSLAERQIGEAIEALMKRDMPLAKRVIEADDQIDTLQRKIEEKAIVTIARRQPMAVDLREIVGALRIANDLERIGDLAENIAKRVLIIADELPPDEALLHIGSMVELVLLQVRRVLHSYAHRDITEALEVWRRDAELDAMNSSLFRELLTYMMEDPHNITSCTHLLFCAKNIERVGDHATNIAETVYYIVQGLPMPSERPKADVTSVAMLPQSA